MDLGIEGHVSIYDAYTHLSINTAGADRTVAVLHLLTSVTGFTLLNLRNTNGPNVTRRAIRGRSAG